MKMNLEVKQVAKIKLEDVIDVGKLKQHIVDGYITCQETVFEDNRGTTIRSVRRVYNYTQLTQYEGKWDEVTTKVRGLITAQTGCLKKRSEEDEELTEDNFIWFDEEIISRGMNKFFNYGELDEISKIKLVEKPIRAFDKIDGCLLVPYVWGDKLCLATRGSAESDHCKFYEAFMYKTYSIPQLGKMIDILKEGKYTPVFEGISKEFRITIAYDYTDIVYLGLIDNLTGEFSPNDGLENFTEFSIAKDFNILDYKKWSDATSEIRTRDNCEGLVCHSGSLIFKLKQQDYVDITKLKMGMNKDVIYELLLRFVRKGNVGETVEEFVKKNLVTVQCDMRVKRLQNQFVEFMYAHEDELSAEFFRFKDFVADAKNDFPIYFQKKKYVEKYDEMLKEHWDDIGSYITDGLQSRFDVFCKRYRAVEDYTDTFVGSLPKDLTRKEIIEALNVGATHSEGPSAEILSEVLLCLDNRYERLQELIVKKMREEDKGRSRSLGDVMDKRRKYGFQVGNLMHDKYKVLSFRSVPNKGYVYDVHCNECGEDLFSKSYLPSLSGFKCKCFYKDRVKKYKLGEIYNDYLLRKKISSTGNRSTKYIVECLKCSDVLEVDSRSLSGECVYRKCSCAKPDVVSLLFDKKKKKFGIDIGSVLLDKYEVIGYGQDRFGNFTYDVHCKVCNEDLFKVRYNPNKPSSFFRCNCLRKKSGGFYDENGILFDKYKILDTYLDEVTKTKVHDVQCLDCGEVLKRRFLSLNKTYFNCNCVSDFESRVYKRGEVYNEKYLLKDKGSADKFSIKIASNGIRYLVECLECGDELVLQSSSLKKGVRPSCSCNSLYNGNMKFKIGEVYNTKYLLKDRYKDEGVDATKYLAECLECGDVFNTTAKSLRGESEPNCSCRGAIKYKIGDVVRDKYVITKVNKDSGHGFHYDLKCLECGDILYNRKVPTKANKMFSHYACSCHFNFYSNDTVVYLCKPGKIVEMSIGDVLKKYSVKSRYHFTMRIDSGVGFRGWEVHTKFVDVKRKRRIPLTCLSDVERKLVKKFNGMWQRCNNSNLTCYSTYGGKGVKIYEGWDIHVPDFVKFALDNGYSEINNFIDRIEPRGDYAPWNVQFITHKENSAKARADEKRTEKQLKLDWKIYERKKKNFYKELKRKGKKTV